MKRVDEYVRVGSLPSLKDQSSFEKAEVTLGALLYKDYIPKIMGMEEELLALYIDSRATFSNLLTMSTDDTSIIEKNEKKYF